LAKTARGLAASHIIQEATGALGVFAFGELLDMPNLLELKQGEFASSYELLRLFAHGTWPEYRALASSLPALSPPQQLKLKQLTVVALAEKSKVLPYDLLMSQLEVTNVRELEDLLINDCMYTGIIRGKLDQQQHCLEVHYAVGRDIRPGQLQSMIHTLTNWVEMSEVLLRTINEKVSFVSVKSQERAAHQAELERAMEEMKKTVKPEIDRGCSQEGNMEEGNVGGIDFYAMEEDRTGARTKRRR